MNSQMLNLIDNFYFPWLGTKAELQPANGDGLQYYDDVTATELLIKYCHKTCDSFQILWNIACDNNEQCIKGVMQKFDSYVVKENGEFLKLEKPYSAYEVIFKIDVMLPSLKNRESGNEIIKSVLGTDNIFELDKANHKKIMFTLAEIANNYSSQKEIIKKMKKINGYDLVDRIAGFGQYAKATVSLGHGGIFSHGISQAANPTYEKIEVKK